MAYEEEVVTATGGESPVMTVGGALAIFEANIADVLGGVDARGAGACVGVDARSAASAAAASFAFFFARHFLCLAATAALSLFFHSSSASFPEGGSGLRAFIGGEAIVGD